MRFKKESEFQSHFIKEIKEMLPGCKVLKNDPNYTQGFPDWTVLYGNKWAVLEIKKDHGASHQPNQDYYVDLLNRMSYSNVVYPENEMEVLNELLRFFK